mgnify:CR=1 FL=1
MAYAAATDLTARYDWRSIADLVLDNGTAAVNQAAVESSAIVATALDDASGEVETSLKRGGRYSTANLAAVSGNSLALLKRITCKIAFWYLWERRPSWAENDQYDQAKGDARRFIEQLRSGELVFDLDDQKDAGNIETSGPTRLNLDSMNLMRDRYSDFYPPRFLYGE